jgi:5-hydroxyisourate hydrolase
MTGSLTTHVLNTASGRPAAGVPLELWSLEPGGRRLLMRGVTDEDGRAARPLLAGDDLVVGRYELLFRVGDYFAGLGMALDEPRFLDEVPVRFAVADRGMHYHVPLLVSPWSYTTYRGS